MVSSSVDEAPPFFISGNCVDVLLKCVDTKVIRDHTIYMNNNNKIINDIDAIPSLVQSKRQIDRYNLDIDAQAILVASRLMAAGAKLGHASRFISLDSVYQQGDIVYWQILKTTKEKSCLRN